MNIWLAIYLAGAALVFIAHRYEYGDKKDAELTVIPSMIFWPVRLAYYAVILVVGGFFMGCGKLYMCLWHAIPSKEQLAKRTKGIPVAKAGGE